MKITDINRIAKEYTDRKYSEKLIAQSNEKVPPRQPKTSLQLSIGLNGPKSKE